jgi:hypothetical protein
MWLQQNRIVVKWTVCFLFTWVCDPLHFDSDHERVIQKSVLKTCDKTKITSWENSYPLALTFAREHKIKSSFILQIFNLLKNILC